MGLQATTVAGMMMGAPHTMPLPAFLQQQQHVNPSVLAHLTKLEHLNQSIQSLRNANMAATLHALLSTQQQLQDPITGSPLFTG